MDGHTLDAACHALLCLWMPYVLVLPRRVLELEQLLLQGRDLCGINIHHPMPWPARHPRRQGVSECLVSQQNMHWQGLHCFRLTAREEAG